MLHTGGPPAAATGSAVVGDAGPVDACSLVEPSPTAAALRATTIFSFPFDKGFVSEDVASASPVVCSDSFGGGSDPSTGSDILAISRAPCGCCNVDGGGDSPRTLLAVVVDSSSWVAILV